MSTRVQARLVQAVAPRGAPENAEVGEGTGPQHPAAHTKTGTEVADCARYGWA